MASKRIDVTVNSSNAGTGFKQASNDIKQMSTTSKTTAASMKNDFTSMGSASQTAFQRLKTQATTTFQQLRTQASTAIAGIKNSFSSLSGALSGVLAGASLSQFIDMAGQAESKWNRIGVLVGETGSQLKATKTYVSQMANQFGVATGEASSLYETMVRFEGSSAQTDSNFKGVLATSKLTGMSVESIYSAIQSGELGRSQTLKKQLLTEAQRQKYLSDGKITQEEINQILAENANLVANNSQLTSDTASNYQRMWNQVNKIAVTIGASMLPAVTLVANVVGGLAAGFSWINDATGGIAGMVAGIGLLGITVGAAVGAMDLLGITTGIVTVATYAWTAAQWLLNVALSANPIGLIIIGIAALIGVIYALTTDLGGCRTAIVGWGQDLYNSNSTIKWIVDGIKWLVSGIQSLYNTLSGGQGGLIGFLTFLYNINPQIKLMVTLIQLLAPVIVGQVIPALQSIGSSGSNAFSRLYSWALRAYNYIRAGVSGIIRVPLAALQAAYNLGVKLYNYIKRGASGAIRIATGAISSAYNMVTSLYNKVRNGVTGVISILTSSGPGVGLARGPGGKFDDMSFKYQNYAGSQRNPFVNGGLEGNCVDMSLGLMALNGGRGKLVQGTWNGGPHVWYQDPSGKNYDPARKALNGTWNPPARGPGDGYNNTYVFNAPVYDWDKFQKDVAKANDRIIMGGI